MSTFAIVPGGGDSPLSWGPATAELRALGHEAIAVDLPVDDASAGWPQYAQAVAAAVRGREDIVVVGHSLGGFAVPLVCELVRVRLLVMVAAMIPTPGARLGEYWSKNGYHDARFDEDAFYHDLSPEARELAKRSERDLAEGAILEPHPLRRWPDVPTRYLLCRDDRCFPAAVSRRVVPELLGIQADEIDGGHCIHLAKPRELAQRLHGYAAGMAG